MDIDPDEEKYEPREDETEVADVKTEFIELQNDEREIQQEPEIKIEDNVGENEDPLAVEPGGSSLTPLAEPEPVTEPRLCFVLLDRIDVDKYICPDTPDSFLSADDDDDIDYYPLEEEEAEVEAEGAPPHNPDGTRIWQVPFKAEASDKTEVDEVATESEDDLPVRRKRQRKKKAIFKCDFCPKVYKYEHTLLKHEHIHPEAKKLICEFCGKRFISRYYVLLHCRNDHTEEYNKSKNVPKSNRKRKLDKEEYKQRKCEICNKEFTSSYYLKLHKVVHTNERRFTCDICNASFKRGHHLKNHITCVHLKYRIPCPNCEKSFNNKHGLEVHLKNKRCKSKTDSTIPKCDNCCRTFKTLRNYQIHMLYLKEKGECRKDQKTKYKCQCSCNEKFKTQDELDDHWIKVHKRKNNELICIKCDKKFDSFEFFKLHLSCVHFTEPYFPCDYCQTIFESERTLFNHFKYYHELIQSDKNFLVCDFCNAKIPSKPTLICHIRLAHLHKKKYSCGLCGKWFNKLKNAGLHRKRRHLSKKTTFHCNICEKSFNTKDELVVHEYKKHKIEIDPCNLECNICFRKFQLQSYLDLHILLKHKMAETSVQPNTEA